MARVGAQVCGWGNKMVELKGWPWEVNACVVRVPYSCCASTILVLPELVNQFYCAGAIPALK